MYRNVLLNSNTLYSCYEIDKTCRIKNIEKETNTNSKLLDGLREVVRNKFKGQKFLLLRLVVTSHPLQGPRGHWKTILNFSINFCSSIQEVIGKNMTFDSLRG